MIWGSYSFILVYTRLRGQVETFCSGDTFVRTILSLSIHASVYILLWLWAVFFGSDKCNTAWANNLKLSGHFKFAGLGGRDEVKCEVYVSCLSLSSSEIYDRHGGQPIVDLALFMCG